MALYKRGNVWWYHFFFRGTPVQESARTRDKKVAVQVLAARRTQLALGTVGNKPKAARLRVNDLLDGLLEDWTIRAKLSSQNLSRLAGVRADFGARWADELTEDDVTRYIAMRQKRGDANASINRTC